MNFEISESPNITLFTKSLIFRPFISIVADPSDLPTSSGSFRITLQAGYPLLYELFLSDPSDLPVADPSDRPACSIIFHITLLAGSYLLYELLPSMFSIESSLFFNILCLFPSTKASGKPSTWFSLEDS